MLIKLIKRNKHHIKSTFWYLGSSLLVALMGILVNPLMASNLSHNDYAIIGYYSSFSIMLIPILHFNIMSFFLRKYYTIPEDQRVLTKDTILISLACIGICVLILFTIVFYFLHKQSNVEFPFFPYTILTFSQIYASLFLTFYLLNLKITRQAKKYGIISIISSLISIILSILLVVYYKFGADGRLWALLIGSIAFGIYSFCKTITKWQFDFSILKEALIFGCPLTISAILWYFLSGVDRAMLTKLNDSYTFGTYCVGIQISSYLYIFYTSISNAFDPDIYQAISQKRIKKLIYLLSAVVIFVAVANLAFIITAPYIIDILTAGKYINSAKFAQILALHNIALACYGVVTKLFIGYGYVKTELVVRIMGAIFAVALFRLLIDEYGFYGAAWGQVSSFLLLSFIGFTAFFIVHKRITKYE